MPRGKKAPPKNGEITTPATHRPEGGVAPGNPWAWKPGQTGNPGGRPKSSVEVRQRAASFSDIAIELQGMAVQIAHARAARALAILQSDAPLSPAELEALGGVIVPVDIAAAQALLDRAHGKTPTKVDDGRKNPFDEMTPEELQDYIITQGGAVIGQLIAERKAKQ